MSDRDSGGNSRFLLWVLVMLLWAKSCGPDPNDWKIRDLQRRIAVLESQVRR